MKSRQGFVSNSSSTSFCIYGVYVDDGDLEKLECAAENLELYHHYGQYDGIYIGRAWSSIKDDETGKQFRESTQELVNKLPIENKECDTYEEGWYDG